MFNGPRILAFGGIRGAFYHRSRGALPYATLFLRATLPALKFPTETQATRERAIKEVIRTVEQIQAERRIPFGLKHTGGKMGRNRQRK